MLSSGKGSETPSAKWPAIKTSACKFWRGSPVFTAQQVMSDTPKTYRRRNHITQPATITPATNMAKQ